MLNMFRSTSLNGLGQSTRCIYFSINRKVPFGQSVFVAGNIEELGNWKLSTALKLQWKQGHNWCGRIKVKHEEYEKIKYKYVVSSSDQYGNEDEDTVQWEEGSNRQIILPRQSFYSNKTITLYDQWQIRTVKICLPYEFKSDRYSIYIQRPSWFNESPTIGPEAMQKVLKNSNHDSKGLTTYWQTEFSIPFYVDQFNYQYVIKDNQEKRFIWTRDQKRVFRVKDAHDGDLSNAQIKYDSMKRMYRRSSFSTTREGLQIDPDMKVQYKNSKPQPRIKRHSLNLINLLSIKDQIMEVDEEGEDLEEGQVLGIKNQDCISEASQSTSPSQDNSPFQIKTSSIMNLKKILHSDNSESDLSTPKKLIQRKCKSPVQQKRRKPQSDTILFTFNKSCYHKVDCNFISTFVITQVNEFLFFGGCPELSSDYQQLADNKIGCVVNTLTPIDFVSYNLNSQSIKQKYQQLKISVKNTPIQTKNAFESVSQISKILKFIRAQVVKKQRVFIHSQNGHFRSPLVALLYLYRYEKMSLETAKKFIKEKCSINLQRLDIAEIRGFLPYIVDSQ